MRKLFVAAGLAALVLATEIKTSIAKEKEIIYAGCASPDKVEYVAKNIPKHFKKTRQDTYLIENVPESKNGYNLGGRLTVYIPEDSEMSVFDRTDSNPSNWYNVSNWQSHTLRSGRYSLGCADSGIYLTGIPGRELSKEESQTKFNAFVNKVYDIIKAK